MLEEQDLVRTLLAEHVKLLAYIHAIIPQADVVEDIYQEVCVRAVEKRAQIRDVEHLQMWLRTAARFQALKVLRSRRTGRQTLGPEALDSLDRDWRFQEGVNANQYIELLRQCVRRLSEKQRALLDRRFAGECDYTVLAKETGRSVSSLYVTFSRIYGLLSKCISDGLSAAKEE